ncbi:ATP-binding protein [Metabacillus arenae]|uniref:histidine kinase n=1 Tax=Metabacillus arenae TaxID=2771434 RepID=A0A926RX46_9BACI|nr:ATP-binding protein [Metabacillus arenae]MBD1381468.1 PAS domain S-box protein [Metabacillus arenae]
MKKTGQIVLVMISIVFTSIQILVFDSPFQKEWIDFIIATTIAWIVGWQYDKVQFYGKERKESEESYKQLIESLPEAVVIHHQHQILYVNKAAVEMMCAQDKNDLINCSVYEFIIPEYKERAAERIKQAQKTKKPLMSIEHKIRRLDGKIIFFEVSSMRIMYSGKEATLTIGRDITDRREQTDRLLQKSDKLALVGQMAAGIAHEIRNPLTSIKGFIQLFRANIKKEEYFTIVLTELDRINLIVEEFLVLAKPSASVFKEKDVRSLIHDVVTLINTQSIMTNVQIIVDIERDVPMISCEENQLKQVFINILKNAIEAMPNGGVIELKVKAETGKISIFFIDQGSGIPKERIPSLGEPFYTTKEKGTGLGLMTCFKIVESHNGELKISSELNVGTTIEIVLPTINQPYLNNKVHA